MVACRGIAPVAIALLVWAGRAAGAGDDPSGWWIDESGRAGILIAPCGDRLCGTIEWLKEPLDPVTRQPKLDRNNADPAAQTHPICGLKMLWDFSGDDPGEWSGGRIYDPESGNTYKSHIALKPDGTLKVRGYIGIPLIGRSQIWTRPPQPPARCEAG